MKKLQPYKQKIFRDIIENLQGQKLNRNELKIKVDPQNSIKMSSYVKYLAEMIKEDYIFQPSFGIYSANQQGLDKFYFDVNFRVKMPQDNKIHITVDKNTLGDPDKILVYNLRTNKGKIIPIPNPLYQCSVCSYRFSSGDEYYEIYCPACGNDDYTSFKVMKGGDE